MLLGINVQHRIVVDAAGPGDLANPCVMTRACKHAGLSTATGISSVHLLTGRAIATDGILGADRERPGHPVRTASGTRNCGARGCLLQDRETVGLVSHHSAFVALKVLKASWRNW